MTQDDNGSDGVMGQDNESINESEMITFLVVQLV